MNNEEYIKKKLKAISELLRKLNEEIHKITKLLK
jgi:prefoldin subunit 5|tara:strand:+ start:3640 stop:3741 length:102 start_codon:yes stop_codon:yes gene_type:complete